MSDESDPDRTKTSLPADPGEAPTEVPSSEGSSGSGTSGGSAGFGGSRTGGMSRGIGRLSRSSSQSAERFMPGEELAGRYRIIGLLGRGGMGEVYRADDTVLDQPVALKFLPPELENDPERMQRFMHEVRIARQVSHPNVCRVYDIGQINGMTYLSMEFVDGEDLSTLLRRIGRLPGDKTVEVARQLCAGLAAAHKQGIVHRDLKPANIMLDDEGRARITDFGLAGLADTIEGAEIRAGTPDYMAPEQLTGKEVTIRSDIYALGLVLYELFTGKRAFEARSLAELKQMQQSSTPTRASSHVQNLDPAVERVLEQCLQKDPERRPSSALAVSAALPGGDPLTAALEAGETPSAKMVAQSGDVGALTPGKAIGAFGLVLVILAVVYSVSPYVTMADRLEMKKSPTRLSVESREFFEEMGFEDRPAETLSGFGTGGNFYAWFAARSREPDRWDALDEILPSPLTFAYRESDEAFAPVGTGGATWSNPDLSTPGTRGLLLDYEGRLQRYVLAPPRWSRGEPQRPDSDDANLSSPDRGEGDAALGPDGSPDGGPAGEASVDPTANVASRRGDSESNVEAGNVAADGSQVGSPPALTNGLEWPAEGALVGEPALDALLDRAGLSRDRLTPVAPEYQPMFMCDARQAFVGTYAGQPDVEVRVEYASLRGVPVHFRVDGPWFQREGVPQPGATFAVGVMLVMLFLIIGTAAFLVRRNIARGRGDFVGSRRVAVYAFFSTLLVWFSSSNHSATLAEIGRIMLAGIARSLLYAGVLWLAYMAVEPFLRRLWPEILISWNRLLRGRWRDPMVGRDILLGSLTGGISIIVLSFSMVLPRILGQPEAIPASSVAPLSGWWATLSIFSIYQLNAFAVPLLLLVCILPLRWLLKKDWIVMLVMTVVLTGLTILANGAAGLIPFWVLGLIMMVYWGVFFLVLTRIGLLAAMVTYLVANSIWAFPITLDTSRFYFMSGNAFSFLILIVSGLAAYFAMAGQPILKDVIQD